MHKFNQVFKCKVVYYSDFGRVGCPVSTVVGTRASHIGHPGSITGFHACELGYRSPYWTDEGSTGYSG
ncbi:hypothetical protein DPMN_106174 [Dreissena polymorpha]|uniref:Uncharacterized protein n=1 Tax=Dreissena polymorpha TaxID=45954 RepID=A0A9D4K4I1_DREPO|nr:hypothetical protein DPMN_106174 [Dreissena polymorpha]